MAGATRSIEVNAPAEVLFDVIADYEKYPEFLSDMESVRVLRTDGDDAQVEFTLNLEQPQELRKPVPASDRDLARIAASYRGSARSRGCTYC